jgi:hypothetical protein
MNLSGSGRTVVAVRDGRVVARHGDTHDLPQFAVRSGGFVVASALSAGLLQGAGIPVPSLVLLPMGWTLFHGLGSAGGALLGATFKESGALRGSGLKLFRVGPFALVFRGGELTSQSWPAWGQVQICLGLRHTDIGRKLALGAFHKVLPDAIQKATVAALCDVQEVEDFVRQGLPETVVAADVELWESAAWS